MTNDTPMNRLIWHSLQTCHARFAEGSELALTFQEDVSPFIASKDDSAASLNALSQLVNSHPHRKFLLMQKDPIHLPDTVFTEKTDTGVQMILDGEASLNTRASSEIIPLTTSDAAEMLALATLTEPGPFFTRTHEMGNFCGIKRDGKLIAMAGERLKIPGMSEITAVCTHPDYRGQGLATHLIKHAAQQMQQRGETPFLHTYASNTGAISLYKHLGFRLRCDVNLAVITAC
ncbi:GNAT family N-acetyltransferase [Kordiimonas sediminis]|uniref:GNAT family N-acetyltransferase n=1 Tax=Kordiimonas sediminis TaxID=1735581 RepID=A0A919E5E3_9PROT|nr:GNAT family N-acetyltransferase [Kordiimonas sediminis]GHF14603.1 GNAT family N-acetyltransferase [Kordiimonas sediminis]